MKTMMLSFKPEVFEKLANGTKIYEHRRVFPDEPVKAYIYVSRPIQAIKGIVYLGNKAYLEEWKDKFAYDPDAVKRIENYLENNRHKVVMEVQKFQNTSSIPLSQIKKEFPDFLIPQMYYYLDGSSLLEYLESNLDIDEDFIEHDFSKVTSNMICVN